MWWVNKRNRCQPTGTYCTLFCHRFTFSFTSLYLTTPQSLLYLIPASSLFSTSLLLSYSTAGCCRRRQRPQTHLYPIITSPHPSPIMRTFSLALGLFALPLAFAGDAPVVQNNPIGTKYIAKLPDKNDTSVRGAVVVETSGNGTGVNVEVSVSGLPSSGGPFSETCLSSVYMLTLSPN